MTVTIVSNNHCRGSAYSWWDLPDKVQEQVRKDYEGLLPIEDEEYIVYGEVATPVCDIPKLEGRHPFPGWDGYVGWNAWAGMLIRACDHEDCECDGQGWIVGRYYS